jgi:O-antigen ligase
MFRINYISVLSNIFYFFPLLFIIGPAFANSAIYLSVLIFLIYISTNKLKIFTNIFFKIFFFFWFVLLLSSFVSEDAIHSIKTSFFFIRYGFLLLILKIIIEKNKKFLDNFYNINFILILFISTDGIIQFTLGSNLFGMSMEGLQSHRFSGVFGTELILGSFLAKITLIVCGIGFFKNKVKQSLLLLCFALVCIFISGERASLILFYISLVYILILIRNYKFFYFLTLSLITVIVGFIAINSEGVKKRLLTETYQGVVNTKQSNKKSQFFFFTEGHQVMYLSSFKMFQQNPILGIGPGNYRIKCNEKKYFISDQKFLSFKSQNGDELINHCNTHPHNYYIQLLAETGIIGFSFLLLSFLIFIYYTKKFFLMRPNKKNENLYNFQIFILGNILIHLWPITTSGNFFGSSVGNLFWLPFGFLFFFKKFYK